MIYKRTKQIKESWRPESGEKSTSNSSDNTPISDGTRLDTTSEETSHSHTLGTNLSSITDAVVTDVVPKGISQLPTHALSTAKDNLELSIMNFLGKPYRFANGTFASTDGPSTFQNYDWSGPLTPDIIKHKLNGVLGIKATLVLTLVANPNRFQRGRYILAFLHTGGISGTTALNYWITSHRYSKVQITQLPHVEFDIASDTQVQLKVPWACAMNYYPLNSSPTPVLGSPGIFFIYPYVALSSTAGSSTCGFSLFTHFEDITLVGNTYPQAGWTPQAGNTRKGKDLLSMETVRAGPITGGVRMVRDISKALSSVPVLSSIATPATWVLDAMAGAAAWFGWSKPINLHHVRRVNQHPFPMLCNVDSQDVVAPLSLTSTNCVDVLPGFAGSEHDELSIDYLKTIPYWWQTITWTTSQPAETVLLSSDIYPGRFSTNITDSNGNGMICRGPISWLSDKFMYYSGSVNIHLKIVKTEFHSGRLMFAFFPQESLVNTGDPSGTMTNYNYVHRELYDVRMGNEITINIPFTSILNWRPTTGIGASYGWFSVMVQDPLTAPATVSTSIDIIVEVSGGKDLQFSVPKQNSYTPVIPSSYQAGWTPQAGEVNVLTEEAIGTSELVDKDLRLCSLSIGEAIPSLRWLLKRGGHLYDTIISTSTQQIIIPFGFNLRISAAAGTTVVSDTKGQSVDIYSELSQMYAISRGGVRIRLLPYTQGTTVTLAETTVNAYLRPLDSMSATTLVASSSPTTSAFTAACRNLNISSCYMQNGVQYQIPQYSFTHSRASAAEMIGTSLNYGAVDISTNLQLVTMIQPTSVNYSIYRSGADDCSFGLFVSIPPYM